MYLIGVPRECSRLYRNLGLFPSFDVPNKHRTERGVMSRPGIGTHKPLSGRLSFIYRDDARVHERGPCHATQEQEEGIMDIFKSFDSNGDGLVTKSELREALWSLGQHPCDEEIDNLFQVYDGRKVGALDSSDFRRLILAKISYKDTRQEYMEAFRAINHDKDGSLDIGGMKRLMASVGCGLTDRELEEVFAAIGKDGSGRINLEEFVDNMMNA